MRRYSLPLLTVSGLLLLSGCFKIDADFTVNADETVDGTMIVAIDKETRDMLSSMGEGSTGDEDLMDLDDLPEGADAEEYDDGDFVGQEITFEGVGFEELMSGTDADGEVTDEWSLTHEDGELTFDGTFDLTSEDDEFDTSALMKGAEISISMEFPGDVSEANGDIDGNTVTWSPEVGETNEMHAVAADEAGFPYGLVAGLVAGFLLLAALAAFLVLSRRTSSPRPSATPPATPPGQADDDADLTPRV